MDYTIKESNFLRPLVILNKDVKVNVRYVAHAAKKAGLDPEHMVAAFKELIAALDNKFEPKLEKMFYKHFQKGNWVYIFINPNKKHLLTVANKAMNMVVKINIMNYTMSLNTIYDGNLVKINGGYKSIAKDFTPLTENTLTDLERNVHVK